MTNLAGEIRYAIRTLRSSPGFALLAIFTMALAMGPNTAIFTLLYDLLFRPVPQVTAPHELVLLRRQESRGTDTSGFSHPGYLKYRDSSRLFQGLAAFRTAGVHLAYGGGRPEEQPAALVTGNYFSVLGIRPAHGRLIGPADDVTPGAHPVAVISDSLWTSRFGRDPHVLGRFIELNRFRFTVIGVAPPEFRGTEWGSDTSVWVPYAMESQMRPMFPGLNDPLFAVLDVIGRLKPAAGRQEAQAELDVLAAAIEEPTSTGTKARVILSPGIRMSPEWRVFAVRFAAMATAAVSLVLIVACANVANLMLARAARRLPEIAMRRALGASTAALVRQSFIESLLIAIPSGLAGFALARWLTSAFARLLGEAGTLEPPRPSDPVVFAYIAAITLLTGVAFGLALALSTHSADLVSSLKRHGPVGDRGASRLRRSLVVAQVALSLVGIVTSALFVRSLLHLQSVNPGYNPDGVFYLQSSLRQTGYSEARVRQFYEEILRRVRTLPGVRAAALANSLPPGWMWDGRIEVEGRPVQAGQQPLRVGQNTVGPGFFDTIGAPLIAGRGFESGDHAKSVPVAVINETMARQCWPGQNPLGKRFRWVRIFEQPWMEVVGVTRDAKYESLGEQARPHVTLPFSQNYMGDMKLVVSATDLKSVTGSVTREYLAFDANVPAPAVRTARQHLRDSLTVERFNAVLISMSGGLAVLIAAVGLYAVISGAVAQRTREIAMRVALGAGPAQVLQPILWEGLRLTSAGLIAGVLITAAASRLLASHLEGVAATDPWSYAAGCVLLGGVAFLACWIPGRRALRVNPADALRCE